MAPIGYRSDHLHSHLGSQEFFMSFLALNWHTCLSALMEISRVLVVISGLGKVEARLKLAVVDAVLGKLTSHGKHEIHGFRIIHCVEIV